MSDRYKGAILSPTAPTVTPQSAGGIYTSSQQLQYQGQGVWPTAFNNPINNSLRFRASASAYLNRTQSTPTTATKWTYSYWAKRGSLSSYQTMISGTGGFGSGFLFNNDDTIGFYSYSGGYQWNLVTSQVFRDPSAWYHIMVAYDSTQATDTNRVKVYVNGTQVTAFSTATYPTQNTVGQVGGVSGSVRIGLRDDGFYYFDGYLAEMYFVDGVQLTPSSFGTTDAYGIWQPIPYTGAYGNNGFYLPFTDNSALTTSSNVGLGKDFSGNGNYWVTNNISITAGSTYDSMKDVPTNTNSNTANYAVWNPITVGTATVTNGNLTSTGAASTGNLSSILIPTSGKWYAEFTWSGSGAGTPDIGIFSADVAITATSARCQYRSDGSKVVDATVTGGYGATYTNGDVIAVAVDVDSNTVTFYKNNASQGAITYTSSNGRYAFNVIAPNSSWILNANFGQRPFSYTPPSGFYPLNTYNLPTPTILDGDQYMDATLYTGNSSTQVVTNSGSMQPDFLWMKARSAAYNNALQDAIRGAGNTLYSNLTNAADTQSSISSFNSNGFTLANDSFNQSGVTYVGWQWRASNAAGVSNTQGTITSTVSANTTAGFSVVTYSGASTTSTVGHGLGVAPSMVIVKSRNTAGQDWQVYHTSLGQNQIIQLNATSAAQTYSNYWYNGMTSSVFGVNNYSGVNASGTNYVAYCFAQVAGYSAFGSYTGNGSTDGPFVYTGFRPRFVMIKLSSNQINAASWVIWDTSRSPYNLTATYLNPNTSDAESTDTNYTALDILSNGFKIRSTNTYGINQNGAVYIYACFAENPFKIARGR